MPPPPDTYYARIDARLPAHGEKIDRLQALGVLIDGEVVEDGETKMLLQIFSRTMIGPIFFEFIQRKGDEGFGEGNFRALFEIDRGGSGPARRPKARGRGVAPMAATPEGYMPGFGNEFETEALPGRFPSARTRRRTALRPLCRATFRFAPSPRRAGSNARSWLYRIRPSVRHAARFAKIDLPYWTSAPAHHEPDLPIGPYRWSPRPIPEARLTFVRASAP